MPNRVVPSASIALFLISLASPARPDAFTVLQHFPVTAGSFNCTLAEVAPDLFVGTYDTQPAGIFGLSANGPFAIVATLSQTVEGNLPKGPLFAGSDGYIYGSTDSFGTNPLSFGVLFRLGAYAALSVVSNQISFSSPVIEGTDGNLYGTGLNSDSAYGLYKISRSGQLLAFDVIEASVATPLNVFIAGPVTQASDGNFYGEAWFFPEAPYIFKVTQGGDVRIIYQAASFAPIGGLVEGPNGLLYGVSQSDFEGSQGSIFSVTKSGQQYTNIYTFGTASSLPQAGLMVGSDGNLYGTSSWIYGGIGNGPAGVFRLSLDGSSFAFVQSFGSQFAEIVNPGPALIQGNDGKLFGAVNTGLVAVLFSLDLGLPAPPPLPGAFYPMQGAPGTSVRIAGQHLLGATSVLFNGTPAAILGDEGPNFVAVQVPAGATSGPITLTAPNGSAVTLASFTVE